MRGRRCVRRVLILALVISVLGLAGHAGAVRIVRGWDKASAVGDSAWVERPWCLWPSRPYLCLLEYRFSAGGGLAAYGFTDWFAGLGPSAEVSEKATLE
jgi:hypothetical protein